MIEIPVQLPKKHQSAGVKPAEYASHTWCKLAITSSMGYSLHVHYGRPGLGTRLLMLSILRHFLIFEGFFFNDSVNELVLLGRDIERDESKGIECLQSNLHCRLDLFSDAQGFAEDVVEEVATIPKRKTSKRLLRRKKPTLDDLRREMRMVSPRWRGRVRGLPFVSSPDPDSQQLRVDYITATWKVARSGDVIHPQLLGIWVWGRD